MDCDKLLKAANSYEALTKRAGEYRTLYHFSKHGPAKPRPASRRPPDDVWRRPWLKGPVTSGVFLTDRPLQVYFHHGVYGALHIYKVSNHVIKEAGGLHGYDGAREIIIPEDIWYKGIESKSIIYLGAMPESKWEAIRKDYKDPLAPIYWKDPNKQKYNPFVDEITGLLRSKHPETSVALMTNDEVKAILPKIKEYIDSKRSIWSPTDLLPAEKILAALQKKLAG